MPQNRQPAVTHRPTQDDDECHSELSDKYTEYIDDHLETLRTKCVQINVCIDKLLEDENVLVVLGGYDLSLNKTCSLVYKSGTEMFGNFSGKCTADDRDDIRSVIEQRLGNQFEDSKSGWKSIKTCLDKNYKDVVERSAYVDEICGLAHNKTQICSSNGHRTVETFFNDQIQHLKCTCRALQIEEPSGVSKPIIIAAAVGCVLLLLALFAIGFICYRQHLSKKRKQKTPNVVYVQAPSSENCPVYQEIFDDRGYPGYKQSPSLKPPTLPVRYSPSSSKVSGLSHLAEQEDDSGYLEPAKESSKLRPQLPIPGNSNPHYGAPPEYRENYPSETENGYFEPLPSPDKVEDRGVNTLGRTKSDHDLSQDAASSPIPAKRTKIDDQRTESPYFVLEDNRDSRTENVSV